MSDLPEMMSGAIALEYHDTVHTAWMSYGEEQKEPSRGKDKCDSRQPCNDTVPVDCTVDGQSCPVGDCKSGDAPICAPRKADFHPVVAGWSVPPPLPPA
jgi:hypothetical protein